MHVGGTRRSLGLREQGSRNESHRSSTSLARLGCLGLQTEPASPGQEGEPGVGCGVGVVYPHHPTAGAMGTKHRAQGQPMGSPGYPEEPRCARWAW